MSAANEWQCFPSAAWARLPITELQPGDTVAMKPQTPMILGDPRGRHARVVSVDAEYLTLEFIPPVWWAPGVRTPKATASRWLRKIN